VDRCAAAAIGCSLAGLPFLLPHVVEDFQLGIAQRAGLSTGVAAALLGAGFAVQMLGLVLAGRGRPAGLAVTAVAGLVWALGALLDHGPELWARGLDFRSSGVSSIWVLGLLASQALAAAFALAALLRRCFLSLPGRGSG
jgi:hypothetical protein